MRAFILALSALAIFAGANLAKAGPSTTVRDESALRDETALRDEQESVDAATPADATQQTEDRIGLDKAKRRYLQRGLTRLGFDTKANGKFDQPTRAVISRWQAARGYPETGFLNIEQHAALKAEIVSAAQAKVSDKPDDATRRRGGGGGRHHRGGGGPGGLIGGVVGGIFR